MKEEAVGLCMEVEGITPNRRSALRLWTMKGYGDKQGIQEYRCPYRRPFLPMLEMKDGKLVAEVGDYDREKDALLLGDIAISMEMASKQAEEYGHSIEREVMFLTTHGVFSSSGYDHMSQDDEKTMLQKQELCWDGWALSGSRAADYEE
jgi:rRNA maturation RNase YbeY